MNHSDRIYVAGHRGLVGSAIVRRLEQGGFTDIVTRTSSELDLRDAAAVDAFMAAEQPAYVFLAAAKVGGIHANNSYPVDFLQDNLQIQLNIISSAHKHGVAKLEFLGSSCIYPKFAEQPIREDSLLTGALEPTNDAYAVAKIAGIKLCEAYNRQYGTDFISVMPTNLYGPGDNFDLENSHVLPALLRKFHEAKESGADEVVMWGTGTPRREFLYVDDMADACVYLMQHHSGSDIVNVGVGDDLSISELAQLVADVTGYEGEIVQDTSKPDGTPRKLLDVSRLSGLGWKASTTLRDGVQQTYDWYLANAGAVRV